MRTTIEVDDNLLRSAMEKSGAESINELVERGLRALTAQPSKEKLLDELRKLGPWEGDLDEMRKDRPHARGEW